ncbi:MAG: MotE family protein, partial [Desulfobia sp.]
MKRLFFLLLILIVPFPAISQDRDNNNPVDVSFSDRECAAAFEARKKKLAARADQLDQREEMLKDLEEELDQKIARWEELQKDLDRKLARFQEKADKDFDNLVEVYSTMRASKAAPLLNGMSSENA